MGIEVRNISKTFDNATALKNVSLKVEDGSLVAFLGPSGCGKTTLLRIISGLEEPDKGSGPILFHDMDVANLSAGQRRVGFVFQHYALFRHMTVFENIAFGLRVKPNALRPNKKEITGRVSELLQLIQMEEMASRYPHQLSGGQRQRVALARALAVEPGVLLLDEPFGALDARVRMELRRWLRGLHDKIGLTSIFVTHDQEEALEVADRVIVMNEGIIEQTGTPYDVFHNPVSEFVMSFIGNVNLFHDRIINTTSPETKIFARPHEMEIQLSHPGSPSFLAIVKRIHSAGPQVKLELAVEKGEDLFVEMTHTRFQELQISEGADVFVSLRSFKTFPADS